MKYFAQFLYYDGNGKYSEALGSDGFLRLDGRLSLDNMIAKCHAQMTRLRKVASFAGFIIYHGDLKVTNNKIIYTYKKEG